MFWLVACVEADLGAFVNDDGSIGMDRSALLGMVEKREVTQVVHTEDAWLTDGPDSPRLDVARVLDSWELPVVDPGERVGVTLEEDGFRFLVYLDRGDLERKVIHDGVLAVADPREPLEAGVGVSIPRATPVDGQLGDYDVLSLDPDETGLVGEVWVPERFVDEVYEPSVSSRSWFVSGMAAVDVEPGETLHEAPRGPVLATAARALQGVAIAEAGDGWWKVQIAHHGLDVTAYLRRPDLAVPELGTLGFGGGSVSCGCGLGMWGSLGGPVTVPEGTVLALDGIDVALALRDLVLPVFWEDGEERAVLVSSPFGELELTFPME